MQEKFLELETSGKINDELMGWLKDYTVCDVIIAGAGPAGLMAAFELAKLDLKILVIDRNNYIGGRLWVNNIFTRSSLFKEPLREILDELKAPYKKNALGFCFAKGLNTCSKLISLLHDKNVRILNMARFDGLIYIDEEVRGVEINYSQQLTMQEKTEVSSGAALKCHMVVDATGVDAHVYQVFKGKNIMDPRTFDQTDNPDSEELLVEKTGRVYPGLAAAGMAVATIYGIPQRGLTLGSILLSGKRAAEDVGMFFAENFVPFSRR